VLHVNLENKVPYLFNNSDSISSALVDLVILMYEALHLFPPWVDLAIL
jgi:hypothetical protein